MDILVLHLQMDIHWTSWTNIRPMRFSIYGLSTFDDISPMIQAGIDTQSLKHYTFA